jgi:hypothetical protein
VVRALEVATHLPVRLGAQLGASVPTHVEECTQCTFAAADHQDAFAADLNLAELPGIWQVGRTGGADPHVLEDLGLLGREDLVAGVVVTAERRQQ